MYVFRERVRLLFRYDRANVSEAWSQDRRLGICNDHCKKFGEASVKELEWLCNLQKTIPDLAKLHFRARSITIDVINQSGSLVLSVSCSTVHNAYLQCDTFLFTPSFAEYLVSDSSE